LLANWFPKWGKDSGFLILRWFNLLTFHFPGVPIQEVREDNRQFLNILAGLSVLSDVMMVKTIVTTDGRGKAFFYKLNLNR
jgi:hypothetical protein